MQNSWHTQIVPITSNGKLVFFCLFLFHLHMVRILMYCKTVKSNYEERKFKFFFIFTSAISILPIDIHIVLSRKL